MTDDEMRTHLTDWQQRAERQYDENVALVAKIAALETEIARLRAERSKEFDHILSGDYWLPGQKNGA